MSDEIKTNTGRVVGSWDGKQATELMSALASIRQQMYKEGSQDKLIAREMPHRDHFPRTCTTSRLIISGAATPAAIAWWEPMQIVSSPYKKYGASRSSIIIDRGHRLRPGLSNRPGRRHWIGQPQPAARRGPMQEDCPCR